MLAHEFKKCLNISDYELDYLSLKDKEHLVISDDFVLKNHEAFMAPMMYTQNLNRHEKGLDYYGTTILDAKASKELIDELLKISADEPERDKLIALLQEAIDENMYVIHFGI